MNKMLLTLQLATDYDVVTARQQTRRIAAMLGFDQQDQTRLSTAVSEIARNTVRFAKGGAIEFGARNTDHPLLFHVRVTDRGPGIPDLDDVLAGKRGMGIISAKRLVDRFSIDSAPDRGTTVLLEQRLPAGVDLTPIALDDIAAKLTKREPQSPFEEIRQQNQELVAAIHELQRRRDELARLNRELADTNRGVIALYAELDERAQYLRRADELKTRFLSHMSHEFRTPVNSILALTQMLIEESNGSLNPEQKKQAAFIRTAAQSLQDLVNDLLDLARIEAGKTQVSATQVRVPDLFSTLRGLMRPLQANPDVNLVFDEPTGLPPLLTDEPKISQILRNLLSNALKFTERGEVRLTARLNADGTISFLVSDTGIGISPDDQERIFQEFVQLKTDVVPKKKGTGLGLSISRRLATLLGGTLTLQSELGKGSTFTLTIPVKYVGPMEVPVEVVEDATRFPVLVVEDKPEDLLFYERDLKTTGFQVIPARSMAEALDALTKVRPMAIVLDILLPDGSGWELLARLKASEKTWNIPVIVITIVHDPERAMALGADDYSTKPIDRKWLLGKLSALAARGPMERVLIVDDNEADRYVLKTLLADTRYSVIEAADGYEALKLVRTEKPHAVFLDLAMPGMSGLEVLEQLKADPETRGIPAIIYTSREITEDERKRLQSGAAAIVRKSSGSREAAMDEVRSALTRVRADQLRRKGQA